MEEGIKEKHQLSVEFHNPVENKKEEEKLGLGFQNPNLDDPTLDHQLVGDRDDELSHKLHKMTVEDSGSVSASTMDQKKSQTAEVVDKEGLIGEEIGEKNDEVGDRAVEGFTNGEFVKIEDTKGSGAEDEGISTNGEVKVEKSEETKENEAGFEEVKEQGTNKEGSKWSEIAEEEENDKFEVKDEGVAGEKEAIHNYENGWGENWDNGARRIEANEEQQYFDNYEGESNGKEKYKENEAGFEEVNEDGTNKEGSKWSEIEVEEENDNFKVKDEGVAGEKEAIHNYENGWGENWDNGARRIEANEEQQYFDNYEGESNGKDKYNEEAHWYGNVDGDSVGLNDGNSGSYHYPLRPDAEDCSFYMRTGTCKFVSNCKFNHPLKRKNQAARDAFKQREENSDRPGQMECKYYTTSGGCKYGTACRYNHSRATPAVAPFLEFNFLGLPIRVGEQECPYYMRNGSCKYGSNCRFNHPNPTVVGGGDSASQGSIKNTISGWSSARTLHETARAPFVPVTYPSSSTALPNVKWNGYQAPLYPASESHLPTPPAFSMNIPAIDANFYAHPREQLIVEEFPERPGQPECSYFVKTGDCKYRYSCKFHHPKNRKTSFILSDQGLPLRPDQSICSHYSRFGICKFGPACKYDHSVTNGNSAGSGQGQPPRYGKLGDADGKWDMEPMQHSV